MSAVRDAIQAAHAVTRGLTGEVMTYWIGGQADGEAVVMTLVPGSSEHNAIDTFNGGSVTTRSKDFIAQRADLLNGLGAAFQPQLGDEITHTADGVTKTYAVLQPEGATACWRFADHHKLRVRVFTRFVGEVAS
ncbi:MAG: hypothetical protein AAGI68_14270 [Planctomycetota bacterium]